MKNVLFIHSSKNFSGGEKVTLELAKRLVQENDITPIIGCLSENNDFIKAAKEFNIGVLELNIKNISTFNVLDNIKSTCAVYIALKKYKIDLVQSVDPVGFRYSALGAFLADVPTAFHFHYPYSNEGLRWFFSKLPKAKHFIFCCESIRNKMGGTLQSIAPQAKLTTIHNGINLDLFTKKAANTSRERRNIVIVGNLQLRKGHKDFLHMASLLKHHTNLKFHIIGDDVTGENNKEALKGLCESLDIEKNVFFHGFVDNVHQLLSEMDILVCASYEEAFPLNILEAMAMGLPVVSTDVDGIPEAITDGKTGLLTKVNSPQSLADKVSELIESDRLCGQISDNAKSTIEEQFSSEIFVKKFIDFYLKSRCD